jgi:hypothetical protein
MFGAAPMRLPGARGLLVGRERVAPEGNAMCGRMPLTAMEGSLPYGLAVGLLPSFDCTGQGIISASVCALAGKIPLEPYCTK